MTTPVSNLSTVSDRSNDPESAGPQSSEPHEAAAVRPGLVHFAIRAAADPATLSRVLDYFARNNILPETVRCRRFVDGDLVIDLRVKDVDDQRVAVIADKLRSSVLVFSVGLEWMLACGAGEPQTQTQIRIVAA